MRSHVTRRLERKPGILSDLLRDLGKPHGRLVVQLRAVAHHRGGVLRLLDDLLSIAGRHRMGFAACHLGSSLPVSAINGPNYGDLSATTASIDRDRSQGRSA